jgi:hypothetical protein
MKYPKVLGSCALCGSDVVATSASFDKPTRKYCSLSCASKSRFLKNPRKYPRVIGSCKKCSNDIVAKNSGFDKPTRTFCSNMCKTSWRNEFGPNPSRKPENRKKVAERSRLLFTGKKKPEGFGASIRVKLSGSKHWNWQGGKTTGARKLRNSLEYKQWRTAVFDRDSYACVICGARNGNGVVVILNADHIKPFSKYPELRLKISNGRTLCLDCHRRTPTFGNRINHL